MSTLFFLDLRDRKNKGAGVRQVRGVGGWEKTGSESIVLEGGWRKRKDRSCQKLVEGGLE